MPYPVDMEALFKQAVILHQADQVQQAIVRYHDLLHHHPQHVDALRYLGLAYAQLHDMPKAIQVLSQALVLSPDDANLHLNLGNACKQTQELDRALYHYQQALALDPQYAQAHSNLAGLYAIQGEDHHALRHYRAAVHAEPGFTPAQFNLGLFLLKHHEVDAAETQFNHVLALDPSHVNAQFYLGVLKLNADAFEEANDAFQQVLIADPEHVDALVNLGVIALKQGREQHAIDYFTKALVLDEHHVEARNNLAATFIHHDRYENALVYYDSLLHDDPSNREYLYNSGVANMGLGHTDKAIHVFNTILQDQDDHVGALSNLAAIEMRLGHRDNACGLLKRVLFVQPDDLISAFMLHAITGDNQHATTCPTYVHGLFNHYAMYYEKHMRDRLNYAVPQRLWEVLHQLTCGKVKRALDLGCGTGLSGVVLRSFCEHLTGVDLADKMLMVAREKHIYDELVGSELVAFLNQGSHQDQYDLVIAADVLPYLGDLHPLFDALKFRLGSDHLVVFTTEISTEARWALQDSVRFCHHPRYIHEVCQANGFAIVYQENMVARQHEDRDLEVMMYGVKAIKDGYDDTPRIPAMRHRGSPREPIQSSK